ncbi:hypothetical protein ABZ341_42325 [Streptomyces sp. NPDC006173]
MIMTAEKGAKVGASASRPSKAITRASVAASALLATTSKMMCFGS